NYYHAIDEILRSQNVVPRRIGIEADFMSLATREQFVSTFPDAELVDVSQATMRQRMLKSDEEINVIKHGARIADLGGHAIAAAIGDGVPEHEVALAGTEAMVREIATTFPHSEIRDTWVWFQSGINTDGAHNWPTTRRIRKGDILSLNCFPMTSGYYTALERTLFYGEPDARSRQLWDINTEVHEAGLKLIKPGISCAQIAHELNEIY